MTSRELDGVDILVVDASRDCRELLSFVLTEAGAMVHAADSVSEATAIAASNDLHVLVTDIALTDGDGVALFGALRARGHSIVGVALTAWARATDYPRTRDAGFAVHIDKPFDVFEFVTVIARLARASERPRRRDHAT